MFNLLELRILPKLAYHIEGPFNRPARLDVSWMDNENWRAPMSIQDK